MLKDEEVEAILIAAGEACRHRKRPLKELQPTQVNKLRRKADNLISDWCLNGVPSEEWNAVKIYKQLVQDYNLVEAAEKLAERNPPECSSKDEVTQVIIFNVVILKYQCAVLF